MDSLIGDLAGRVTALESKTQDRWTKSDQDYWCSRTEQVNADMNWRCAELPGQPRVRVQSDGWEAIRK